MLVLGQKSLGAFESDLWSSDMKVCCKTVCLAGNRAGPAGLS